MKTKSRVISKEVQEQIKSFNETARFKLEPPKPVAKSMTDMVIENTFNTIIAVYGDHVRFSSISDWYFSTSNMYFDHDASRPTIVYDPTFKKPGHMFIEDMKYYGYTFDTLFEVVICSNLVRLNAFKREAARRIEEHRIEEEKREAAKQRWLKIKSLFDQLEELGVTIDTYYSNQ